MFGIVNIYNDEHIQETFQKDETDGIGIVVPFVVMIVTKGTGKGRKAQRVKRMSFIE